MTDYLQPDASFNQASRLFLVHRDGHEDDKVERSHLYFEGEFAVFCNISRFNEQTRRSSVLAYAADLEMIIEEITEITPNKAKLPRPEPDPVAPNSPSSPSVGVTVSSTSGAGFSGTRFEPPNPYPKVPSWPAPYSEPVDDPAKT